jgi:hypothetical protein
MTDTSSAWKAAGERFAALGTSIKAHYEQHRGEGSEGAPPDLGEAARRFTGAIQDAVEALGSAARDPEVSQEARSAGASVADALGVTFAGLSEELHRMAEGARAGAPPGDTPTDAPDASGPTGAPGTGGTEEGRGEERPEGLEPWGTP